jgi:WhiB family redox-sensing transcriptional regulator
MMIDPVTTWFMSGDPSDPFAWLASLTRRPAWMAKGACRSSDPELFFPSHGVSAATMARARAVCAICPVRGECLAHALAEVDAVGVWGGTTDRERRAMRRDAKDPQPKPGVLAG